MTRLYLRPFSSANTDADYGHILSNSIIHLVQTLNVAHLCEMIEDEDMSFACHLDDFDIHSDSVRFVFRLYSTSRQSLDVVTAAVELLTQPFSVCILPEHIREDRPFSTTYRIVNVRPAQVQIDVSQSEAKDGHNRHVSCRAVLITNK